MSAPSSASSSPPHATWVLVGLIAVASVANLNLAVANVALPQIGLHFRCGQTALNLVSVGFSLGLARRRDVTSSAPPAARRATMPTALSAIPELSPGG